MKELWNKLLAWVVTSADKLITVGASGAVGAGVGVYATDGMDVLWYALAGVAGRIVQNVRIRF